MHSHMKFRGFAAAVLLGGVVAGANAQNWSSFWQVQSMTGLSVSYNTGTKQLTASMAPGATVKLIQNNVLVTREVENFFGFYVLTPTGGGGTGPLGATNQQSPTGWDFWDDSQYVAGWRNNPKNNLGTPKTGTFATLNFPVDGFGAFNGWWGMHVTYKNTGGLTEYIRWNGGTPPSNVVPEPFTMGLGIAAAGAFVRRRMKAKAA